VEGDRALRSLGLEVRRRVADLEAHLLPPLGVIASLEIGVRFAAVCGGHKGSENAAREGEPMPNKRPSVKNEKQYEKLKEKGMSKERAARIANSPGASSRGGKKSGSSSSNTRSTAKQGGTTQQKKAAGRKGGKATARKRS
jgi:hypothetical protein